MACRGRVWTASNPADPTSQHFYPLRRRRKFPYLCKIPSRVWALPSNGGQFRGIEAATVVRLQKACYLSIRFCLAVVPLADLRAAEAGSFLLSCTKQNLIVFCEGFWWCYHPRTHRPLPIPSSRSSGYRDWGFHLQNLKILKSHHSIPHPLEYKSMRWVKDERQKRTAKKTTKSWKQAWCPTWNSAAASESIHSWYIGVKRHFLVITQSAITKTKPDSCLLIAVFKSQGNFCPVDRQAKNLCMSTACQPKWVASWNAVCFIMGRQNSRRGELQQEAKVFDRPDERARPERCR